MIGWLGIARASALGWVPLAYKPLPISYVAKKKKQYESEKVVINISGTRYECWRTTLEKYPDTLLGSVEREYFYDEESKEYFIERDPDLFRYILNFYKSGRFHFPKTACISTFDEELSFFGIKPDYVSDCCYEDYTNRKKEISLDEEAEQKLKEAKNEQLTTLRQKIWRDFENPQTSTMALVFYYVTGFFIAVSVFANILETVGVSKTKDNKVITLGDKYRDFFFALDTACVFIFTSEYFLRLFATPNRIEYMCSMMSIIDIVAILPYYISLVIVKNEELSGAFVTLRIFRVFRIFKFSRHSQGLKILGETLKSCVNELSFLLFSLTMVIIIFGTVMYYAEKNVENSKFTSIPSAFWYTIVTMTTLGYGDMVPKTVGGKLLGAFCSLSGVLVIALPVPVIVSNFGRIYHQSQRATKIIAQKQSQAQLKKAYLSKLNQTYIQSKHEKENLLEDDNESVNQIKCQNIYQQQHHHLLSCLEKTIDREFVGTDESFNRQNHRGSSSKRKKSSKSEELDWS